MICAILCMYVHLNVIKWKLGEKDMSGRLYQNVLLYSSFPPLSFKVGRAAL